MSDLERAAAEYLRAQRETSQREAQAYAQAQQAAQLETEAKRRQCVEFYALAVRYGAPLFQRYIMYSGSDEHPLRYVRTDDLCVVVAQWRAWGSPGFEPSWAFTSDGRLYGGVRAVQRPPHFEIVDSRCVFQNPPDRPVAYDGIDSVLVPATAALLGSVWVADGQQTGIQASGCIGYRAG